MDSPHRANTSNEVPVDPETLARLYAEHLGITVEEWVDQEHRAGVAAADEAAKAWDHHGQRKQADAARHEAARRRLALSCWRAAWRAAIVRRGQPPPRTTRTAPRPRSRRASSHGRARAPDGGGGPGGDPDPDDAAPPRRVRATDQTPRPLPGRGVRAQGPSRALKAGGSGRDAWTAAVESDPRFDDPSLLTKAARRRAFGLMMALVRQHTDEDGWAWPKQSALAAAARMSLRSVQRAVRDAEGLGVLETRPWAREDGGNTTLLYRVLIRPAPWHGEGAEADPATVPAEERCETELVGDPPARLAAPLPPTWRHKNMDRENREKVNGGGARSPSGDAQRRSCQDQIDTESPDLGAALREHTDPATAALIESDLSPLLERTLDERLVEQRLELVRRADDLVARRERDPAGWRATIESVARSAQVRLPISTLLHRIDSGKADWRGVVEGWYRRGRPAPACHTWADDPSIPSEPLRRQSRAERVSEHNDALRETAEEMRRREAERRPDPVPAEQLEPDGCDPPTPRPAPRQVGYQPFDPTVHWPDAATVDSGREHGRLILERLRRHRRTLTCVNQGGRS